MPFEAATTRLFARRPPTHGEHDPRGCCPGAGANVKVIQKLLGHKTATLTLDRCWHLYPDDLTRSRPLSTPPLKLLGTG
ncbi:hypothetical protein MFM001_16430 [Mycobacterium sp. MFM001]|nr:hypothetical protein MFM001_16430 [Mycobacterium sp. MFM001]